MAQTKEQIAESVLRVLGQLATGQTASHADLQVCLDAYEGIWAQLQTPEYLAQWGVDDDVPNEAALPITYLVASDVAPIFGVGGNTLALVEAKAANSKAILRSNISTPWNYDTVTEMEYF